MRSLSRLFLLGLIVLTTPGCATAALNVALRAAHPQPAWNGEVVVTSEPEGAECAVLRDERVLGSVPATPGAVRLERSHSVLEVRCRAPNHVETVAELRPSDDPAVFRMAPNGIIGATATVISLARATTMRYPGEVKVALTPVNFATEAARDEWFAERREAALATRARDIENAEALCRTMPESDCASGVAEMRRQQQLAIARLDAQRAQTRIGPTLDAASE